MGLGLLVAVAYGGRWDIAQACRSLAADAAAGTLAAADIDEAQVGERLALAGIPDPDLLIRTGGEQRISNFLLWNLAYTELYFTDVLWPEFSAARFGRRVRALPAARAPLRQNFRTACGESRCLRRAMLRTRILTAAVLRLHPAGGFVSAAAAVGGAGVRLVFTIGAWEWAGFGALCGPAAPHRLRVRRRTVAAAGMALERRAAPLAAAA